MFPKRWIGAQLGADDDPNVSFSAVLVQCNPDTISFDSKAQATEWMRKRHEDRTKDSAH